MKSPNRAGQNIGYGCNVVKFLTYFIIFSFALSVFSQTKAFPSIKGAGSYVTGGRGGIVVKVTTLNDSGPGSLRSALMMTVPRTIVFEVSGTIVLNSSIELIEENSNFTIAGQTAPEGGITISNNYLRLGGGYYRPSQPCNNIIIRHIRFRNGRYTGVPDVAEHNGIISTGCDGFILDHCSFSFCDDQALALGGDYGVFENVSIQRCVFSENATQVIIGLNHPYNTGKVTFIENAFIDTPQRTPNMGGNGQYDVINNYYFNWKGRLSNINAGSPEVNYIGNYMKEGSFTTPGSGNKYQTGDASIYTANNYHSSLYTTPQEDDRDIWQSFWSTSPVADSRFTTTMHPLINEITVDLASNVPNILNDIGTNKYLNADGSFGIYSDSFDVTKIYNAQNNISSDPQNKNWTMPTLPLNTRPASYDSDNDGMADLWEMNTYNTLSHNGTEDTDNDGYTDLEEFLNGIDVTETQGNQVAITSNDSDNIICQGDEVVLTASDANGYVWDSNGETSSSITVTPSVTTTYTVTGTHSNGSTTEAEITITVNPLPTADAGEDIETCLGTEVTLTASGGTSYEWITGETSQSITVNPITTTTYEVEVTQNGCSSTDEVTVTVNSIPNVDAGEDQTIFEGETATLTASGADTYLWSTGETTPSITVNPLLDTSYSVTGTSNGCENTDTVTVFLLDDSVAVDAGEDTEMCIGDTITLTATGGTTYLWNTGETTASIDVSPNTTTTYTVTAFSPSGNNQDQDDVLVTVTDLPIADAGENVEICVGNSTTLTASGGSSYLWNTGETTQSITVNPTETTLYSVEVFENNCSATDDIEVTVNALPIVEAGNDVTIIEGETTTLTASGADTYLWSTGESTQSIDVSPNTTTTYTVTGFLNGCEASSDVSVTVILDEANADAGLDVTICQGESTTLSATGGTTYLWNTGETAASIDVSPNTTTTYTVTAFSPSGNNQDQDDVLVTVTDLPIADAGENVEICVGNSTTLTASGGSSYLWNTGETTQSITVNPTETTLYSVEVFENNCSNTDDIEVTVNALPIVEAGNDVTIIEGETTTLTASGADTYLWSTGESTQSIDVSPNTTTTYTVTGFLNGCEASSDVTVTVILDEANADAGLDVTICQGESTTLSATGGTTYLWNTGETTASIDVSPNTTTTYTVTAFSPSGNNQDQDDVLVTVTDLPIADAGENVEICVGSSTTLTASGGSSYLWNTGETTQSITVNPTETTLYSVEVFENNCSNTDDVEVTVNALPLVDTGTDVSIFDGESTVLTASGADTYLWSTGETSESITVSPSNTATYSVTGFSNSCEATDDIIVTVLNDDVEANAGNNVEICLGESTTLTASGGTTYLWSTGETTASIEVSPNTTTTYTVTAFSPSGNNQDQDDVLVTVNDLPIADAGENVEICAGNSTTLTASGGSSYLWNTGETSQSINVSPTTTSTYSVEVFDGTCTAIDDVLVTVNPLPLVDAGDNVGILEGESTTLTASGADTYLWSTGETTATIEVSPSETTTYTVTGFSNGCEASDDVTVEIITETVTAEILGGDITICEDTTIILTATGGASYLWSTGETTPSIEVNPSETTTYTVTAFSPSGTNQDNDSVTVTVNDLPEANAGANVSLCLGASTELTASGGSSYLWSTGDTTATISVSPNETTLYSVEVFNDECSSVDDVLVTVNLLPTVNAGNDITISEGEATTLTASGADTYLWSTGETTASITVSPNNTTTYSVTGFLNGCEATDEVVVTVNIENITANAGDNVDICNGENTTLTATGGSTYLWSTGETTSSITVSPSETTTYTVTAYNSAQTASDEDTVTVTVNELPSTDAGVDVTISEGEATTLTASGADTYLWNTGETTASITVSPNDTTTYSVTGFSNGCEATDEVVVTVNIESVTANAGDNVDICNGENTTLTATGGSTYLWSTGETTSSITVSPSETTTYTVTAYNSAQTASDEDTVTVTVNELPSTDAGVDVTILEGEATTLTASGADTYLWNTGETTASITVSPNNTTTYSVTGFSNGCEATDEVTVTIDSFVFEASAGENRSICDGYETVLTASEGDSYLWSTGETTQSITVNPSTTQTYSVTVFQGDYQDDADVTVDVNPNPNVVVTNGDDVMILEGEFVTLSASGAESYLWNNGITDPFIAVSPSVTTTYEVTGYINDCEDTKAVMVNVVETVEADAGQDVIICSEETVTLTASGGDEYLWSTGETTQSIEVSPDIDTEYSVLAYNMLDSDEATVRVFVEQCTTVVEVPLEDQDFGFLVYQDSETDMLNVKIDGLQSFVAKGISIYDITGKVLYSEIFNQDELENQSQMSREIRTDLFSSGIYMVKLKYDDTSLVKKIPIR